MDWLNVGVSFGRGRTKTARLGALAVGVVAAMMGAPFVAAGATAEISDGVLTLDGLVTNVTTEADFGADVTNVVLKNGGGVAFSASGTLLKTYAIAGDGLSATGVVSVAAGASVSASSVTFGAGTIGRTFVKTGAGTFNMTTLGAVKTPTRWIVEEGALYTYGTDMFGNHRSTTTNLVLDVREGATYTKDGGHSPIGPLELTGGTAQVMGGRDTSTWGGTAFRGGVVAHPSARVSCISGHAHLNHIYTNVPFTVEQGATLEVRAVLSDGMNTSVSDRVPNRLIVSGGGELRLFGRNSFTGGAELNGGTYKLAYSALGTGPVTVVGAVDVDVTNGADITVADAAALTRLDKRGQGMLRFTAAPSSSAVLNVTAGAIAVPALSSLPGQTTFAAGTRLGLEDFTADSVSDARTAYPNLVAVYATVNTKIDELAFATPYDNLTIGAWGTSELEIGSVSGVTNLRVEGMGTTRIGQVAAGTTVSAGPNATVYVPAGTAVAADSAGIVYVGDSTEATVACLELPGDDYTVFVPDGRTLVVQSVKLAAGMSKGDLYKTGGGTLVLPPSRAGAFSGLFVRDGVAVSQTYAMMDGGPTTVSDGATLRYETSMTQYWTVTLDGAGTIDVPSGVSVTMNSNAFYTAGATFTKAGAGTFIVSQLTDSKAQTDNAHWIVADGCLRLPDGSTFGKHHNLPTVCLEVLSGAVLQSDLHTVLGDVVLRGGTLFNQRMQGGLQVTNTLERSMRWGAFSFNGTVTAYPSPDGRPSRIDSVAYTLLGNAEYTTVFDVRDGAVLEVNAHLQPGENAEATGLRSSEDLVKKGGGELVLLKGCGARGTVDVQDGVVTLGPNARFAPEANVVVASNAKIQLRDGALLASRSSAVGALVASADVWLDASRLSAADGAAVASVPNFGTAGGAFAPFTWKDDSHVLPDVPTFAKYGIDGKGALAFNGAQALALLSYTNRSTSVEVFFVGMWTKWAQKGTTDGSSGYWGSPFSLGRRGMTVNDYSDQNGVSYQHKDPNKADLGRFVTMPSEVSVYDPSLTNGTPYFLSTARNAGTITTTVCTSDATGDVSASATTVSAVSIDVVSIGSRLDPGAQAIVHSTQIGNDGHSTHGENRTFHGRLGELIVFTRTLSDAERASVAAYLKAKWLGSTVTAVSDGTGTGARTNAVTVTVPDGARAAVAGMTGSMTGGRTDVAFTKSGAGTLEFAAAVSGVGVVSVDEGELMLPKGGEIASRADVWFDPTDAAAVERDADGTVVSVANKGRCGGVFGPAVGGNGTMPATPAYVADGINGRSVVAFDGNSALILDSYTNVGWRSQHVYAILRRTAWGEQEGKGHYSGPYSFSNVNAVNNDNSTYGAMHLEENATTNVTLFYGGAASLEFGRGYDATGVDLLHVTHQYATHANCVFERAADDTNNVATFRLWPTTASSNIIDRLVLGGRAGPGGQVQWSGRGSGSNRMWFGQIGEFIVFREQLTYSEECALVAYLRKKWLGKGDGTDVPPAFLSGRYDEANFGSAGLAMANGTRLVHAQTTRSIASLAAAGTVDWARVWGGATVEDLPLFKVAGDVALGVVNLDLWPKATSGKVLGYAGETSKGTTWRVALEGRASAVSVSSREQGWWLSPAGTILIFR